MSPRILDLGGVIAHFQPGPTSPPPTGPGTGDGGRPAPQVTDAAGYTAWLNTLDTDAFIAECRRGKAEFEWTTGKSIWQVS
ncbi:hypothetical protein OG992_18830 [Micromonospora sp. NBC_00362]|uniref:hypothetical protein n=1 Tax=Micromonospora sp. NBC_00362 TaxID=2975975 RepID=UPI0022562702|nr:hypothetical protein [Micromonospora sp. NBC_00362]MCX5119245.1 hypothetical protein [Micromonospora sp. NBC_00362]